MGGQPVPRDRFVVRRGHPVAVPPVKVEMQAICVHVPVAVYKAVQKRLAYSHNTVRELVEWAMRQYLVDCAPDAAAELGIVAEDS